MVPTLVPVYVVSIEYAVEADSPEVDGGERADDVTDRIELRWVLDLG